LSLPHYFATSRRPTTPASPPSSGRSSLSSQVRMPRTSLPSAPPAHIQAALPGRHPHRSLALLWWPPRQLRSCSAVHHATSREHRTDERLVRGQAGPHTGAEVQRGCRESALGCGRGVPLGLPNVKVKDCSLLYLLYLLMFALEICSDRMADVSQVGKWL
jgi:hypothetical protein